MGLFDKFKDSPIFKLNHLDDYIKEVRKKKRLSRLKKRIRSRSKRKRLYETEIIYKRNEKI